MVGRRERNVGFKEQIEGKNECWKESIERLENPHSFFISPISGMNESLLEAKMSFSCQLRGADRLSFPPVVASGANANVIHYIRNDNVIKVGGR